MSEGTASLRALRPRRRDRRRRTHGPDGRPHPRFRRPGLRRALRPAQGVLLFLLLTAAPGPPSGARAAGGAESGPSAFATWASAVAAPAPEALLPAYPATEAEDGRLYLPWLGRHADWPDPALAARIWQAADRLAAEHPPAALFAGWDGPASVEAARAQVREACVDFPDLPDPFGPGAHHRACYAWVAEMLGLYRASAAREAAGRGADDEALAQAAWGGAYLEVALEHMARLVYGPEDAPGGEGHRDTLAALWQNPQRAVELSLIAGLVAPHGGLGPEREAALREILSAVVRAWYAEFETTGLFPGHGVAFTTATAPDTLAYSLAGRQVVSRAPWTFRWDADEGSSPSEEMAWMGAGVLLALPWLAEDLPADEIEALRAAAQRYVDFAVSMDRHEPVHGVTVRTLNDETEGGAYGQNRYWIENHTADVPAIPYLGWTYGYIGASLFSAPTGGQRPWPSLVPDDEQWQVLVRAAEATLHSPDGRFLVDLTPGGRGGFDVATLPAWRTTCGRYRQGTHYVAAKAEAAAGEPPLYVSEIGHPGGLDLLMAGWPLARLAAARGDSATLATWRHRMHAVLDEYTRRAPDPAWAACGVAPYVSLSAGYHWPRLMAAYAMAWLGASGFELELPPSADGAPQAGRTAPAGAMLPAGGAR